MRCLVGFRRGGKMDVVYLALNGSGFSGWGHRV